MLEIEKPETFLFENCNTGVTNKFSQVRQKKEKRNKNNYKNIRNK